DIAVHHDHSAEDRNDVRRVGRPREDHLVALHRASAGVDVLDAEEFLAGCNLREREARHPGARAGSSAVGFAYRERCATQNTQAGADQWRKCSYTPHDPSLT